MRAAERIGWGLLLTGLIWMLFCAVRFDRRSWPALEGDEATYLMQAESLAWDLDIRYSSADHQRFLDHWGQPPEGLILQSLDDGRTMSYGKPLPYSFAIAPFVRLAPVRGATIFNALLLALATLAVAASLRTWIGSSAPWFAAAFVYASVVFAYVPWAHSDLFLAALTATSYSLALRRRAPWEEDSAKDLLVAAGLLGVVIVCRPFPYAALALPLLVARSPARRSTLAAAAVLAATIAGGVGLEGLARGHWTSYGGERLSFDSATGFPDVGSGPNAATWDAMVAQRGPADWTREGGKLPYRFNPRTWAWNAWYFLVGRDVGLLPYYPAVLLALFAFRRDRVGFALLIAFIAVAAGFFLLRPFNFYGGGGALANRYILPAIPALWFMARDSGGSVGRRSLGLVAVTALAALFLAPLWRSPWSFRLDSEGGYRWVGPTALRVLPYETTQSHLKPAVREDFVHRALWIKPLTPGVTPTADGQFLRLRSDTSVDLVVGSPRPLASICLSRESGSRVSLEFRGGIVPTYQRQPLPTRVPTPRPTARHAMWWSEDDWWLYRLRLTADASHPSDTPAGADSSASSFQVQLVPGCIDIRRAS